MLRILIQFKFLLICFLMASLACSPDVANNEVSSKRENVTLDDEVSTSAVATQSRVVSAFALDDKKFQLSRLAIGQQDFMNSKSLVLSYKIPKDADYVEILRCKHDVKLSLGANPVSLVDVELSGITEAEKASLYRGNDYFKAGEDHFGCELVTDGHAGEEFVDTFAPTGSYRYLVRACVAPNRLVDKEKLSGRNCSRRVGVSLEQGDYENLRKDKTNEALKLAAIYSARLDATAASLRMTAENANIEIEACADRNHDRLVNKRLRDAWLTIAAAVIEVAVELKTSNGVSDYFSASPNSLMQWTQLMGAAQGYVLADTFIKIAGSSHDMVRSCDTYKRLMDEYRIGETAITRFSYKYRYYTQIADLSRSNQLAANGEEVEIPQIDMRDFQEVEVPLVTDQTPLEDDSEDDPEESI